jgi:hypothetical protein
MATNVVPAVDGQGVARAQRSRRRARAAAALTSVAALSGVFLVGLPGAGAATIDVTISADGGPGSLRAAIDQANASPGPDVIQVPAGTYALGIAGQEENANATGDLDVSGDLTIIGEGAAVTTIDGAGLDRVLDVRSGATSLGLVAGGFTILLSSRRLLGQRLVADLASRTQGR